MKRLKIFILLLLALFLFSCKAPEHSFSADELKLIDSLYLIQKDSINIEMELICDTIYQENYEIAVDSLRALRQKEIKDILSK